MTLTVNLFPVERFIPDSNTVAVALGAWIAGPKPVCYHVVQVLAKNEIVHAPP